jgi:hypothetical protein
MRGKSNTVGFYKIILFCKNMDDMMHDVMMMHKIKKQANLVGVLPGAVTDVDCAGEHSVRRPRSPGGLCQPNGRETASRQ